MNRYKVAEQFVSINGEGTRAGQLAVFVRFQGCNLNCSYCDTAWANQPDAQYEWKTTEELYRSIKEQNVKNVTLTGGEPLLQPGIEELLIRLSEDETLSVEIETNGSVRLESFQKIENPPLFTMDYKLPSSGMETYMKKDNFLCLQPKDTVKLVAGNAEDLLRAADLIKEYNLTERCHVYVSPVYGKIELEEIVEFMKEHHMNHVTMQLQMHKIIWAPEKRGV